MSSTFHASVLRGEHDEMGTLRIPLRGRGTAQSQQAWESRLVGTAGCAQLPLEARGGPA